MTKYKVIPMWRGELLRLLKQGHPLKPACHALKVGYDRFVQERNRNPDFASEVESAIQEAAAKPSKRFRTF